MASSEGLAGSPVVLGPSAQEFLGVRYYLCGFYYQRKGRRLHRAVWEHHNGPIPAGSHVHHRDGDRSNNGIDNLELMDGRAHVAHHGRLNPGELSQSARDAASRWHKSLVGREWHKAHWHRSISKVVADRVAKSCEVCGKSYETSRIRERQSRFCHQNCKAVALRRRRAAEREAGRLLPRD